MGEVRLSGGREGEVVSGVIRGCGGVSLRWRVKVGQLYSEVPTNYLLVLRVYEKGKERNLHLIHYLLSPPPHPLPLLTPTSSFTFTYRTPLTPFSLSLSTLIFTPSDPPATILPSTSFLHISTPLPPSLPRRIL